MRTSMDKKLDSPKSILLLLLFLQANLWYVQWPIQSEATTALQSGWIEKASLAGTQHLQHLLTWMTRDERWLKLHHQLLLLPSRTQKVNKKSVNARLMCVCVGGGILLSLADAASWFLKVFFYDNCSWKIIFFYWNQKWLILFKFQAAG